MKTVLALACVLMLSGCGGSTSVTVDDPGGEPTEPAATPTPTPAPATMPTEIPAAVGPVRTRGPVTVMDTGRPEVCLGPVAESFPPQCGGPALRGWDWSQQGLFEQQGEVRWGQFALSGSFDGSALRVTEAISAALYDTAVPRQPPLPGPAVRLSRDELSKIAVAVGRLPGAQGAYAESGQVFVDVVYDDGSLQAWTDETYGADVVLVTGALVDAPA